MQPVNLWQLLAIAGLILLSAFFSGTEMAYSSVNSLRLKNIAEKEGAGRLQKLAYWIYEKYDEALTTLLIGNNLVNTAASSIATVIVVALLGSGYAWVATAAMTVLLLIFGEIAPKLAANSNAHRVCVLTAAPLRACMWVAKPVVWLVNGLVRLISRLWKDKVPEGPTVTEDDLENIIETVEDEGLIDEEQSALLQSALDFDDVLAYEIITPRVDMLAIDIEDSLQDVIETASASPYSRLPVYEDTVDNIIGILHLNHFFKALLDDETPDLRSLLMPVCYVHKTTPLPQVLSAMKGQGCHMVIVSDEYGGTMGVLTMEDVLEQLVGDIWDESDEIVDEFAEISDGVYEVDGDMRIYDFFEELDIDDRDFDDDNATVGGWAIEMLGGNPRQGDSFEYEGLEIRITEMQGRRVEWLLVRRKKPAPAEAAQGALEAETAVRR